MEMVRMKCVATHQYAGRRLHAGEVYDCEPQHVELMQRLGWACRAEDVRPQEYQTRDMTAQRRSRGRKK